jgi:transcriptional regulator with XRE-family HTH domain
MSIQEIGALVRERRNLFRLTQLDLAEMTGVSHNTIRKIERGQTNPTVEVLSKLGEVLGFQIELTIPHTI